MEALMDVLNRRTDPRILEANSVAVTILESPGAPQLENETLFCSTEDVSVGGVKLRSRVSPPIDSRLKLLVALGTPLCSFTHAGRVAWLGKRDENGRVEMGVEFTDTPDDVLAQWREVIEHRLNVRQ